METIVELYDKTKRHGNVFYNSYLPNIRLELPQQFLVLQNFCWCLNVFYFSLKYIFEFVQYLNQFSY